MSETTDTTGRDEPTTNDSGREAISHEPRDIKRRLPSGLSSEQERALVCAIRNPDASRGEIAKTTAVGKSSVEHALRSYAQGVLGGDPHESHGTVVERRGEFRDARTFAELTDKQRAVIDFAARNGIDPDRMLDPDRAPTSRAVSERVNESGEYDVTVAGSYPMMVVRKYGGMIRERRAEIGLTEGNLEAGDVESALNGLSVRRLLELSGEVLPDENLDSIEEVEEEGDGLDNQEKLEVAFERASNQSRDLDPDINPSDYLGPLSCPHCGRESRGHLICPNCYAHKIHEDGRPPIRNHLAGGDGPDPAAIRKGIIYTGKVNAVPEYGVFADLMGDPDGTRYDSVSGLLHENQMPGLVSPSDFSEGDYVNVVAVDATEGNSDTINFKLAWPTEERVSDHLGDHPPAAPRKLLREHGYDPINVSALRVETPDEFSDDVDESDEGDTIIYDEREESSGETDDDAEDDPDASETETEPETAEDESDETDGENGIDSLDELVSRMRVFARKTETALEEMNEKVDGARSVAEAGNESAANIAKRVAELRERIEAVEDELDSDASGDDPVRHRAAGRLAPLISRLDQMDAHGYAPIKLNQEHERGRRVYSMDGSGRRENGTVISIEAELFLPDSIADGSDETRTDSDDPGSGNA